MCGPAAVLKPSIPCSVHGDTKSAEQHKRVSLTPSSDTAMCDVCQERNAVLFCSEDRALICRECGPSPVPPALDPPHPSQLPG